MTLIELLMALAVAGVVLAPLLGYVRAARTAATAGETRSEVELTLQLAVELLREELRLSGALPWPPPPQVEGADDPEAFVAEALRVGAGAFGSSVRVRFVDHRLAGAPLAREHTYEARVDGNGEPQLYRRAGTSARQPLVAGVTWFEVVGAVDLAGSLLGPHELTGRRLTALQLEVRVDDATRRFLAELPSAPRAVGP